MMRKEAFFSLAVIFICWCPLEAGFTHNPMDFNQDLKVDLLDLVEFASHWLWEAVPDADEFAFVPAGTFEMGDHFEEGDSDELPVHTVTLEPFYISKYEITNRQYCEYLNAALDNNEIKVENDIVYAIDDTSNSNAYCRTGISSGSQILYSSGIFSVNIKDGTFDMSDHPMVCVSWLGATAYCNWRSEQEILESCYDLTSWMWDSSKNGFRLPTEAEWEYAARGGEKNPYYRYPWGDSIDGSMANYFESGDPYETGGWLWPHTTPVGYYDGTQVPAGVDMANSYGLYDMAGNVSEWCNDFYDEFLYQYCVDSQITTNPVGPALASYAVVRGGSWENFGQSWRVANRDIAAPTGGVHSVGFRVCVFSPLSHVNRRF
ncbi:MAG: formylglycine-generating enzyme family protein [Planctomycetota bacterium]|jgi:formylglycine-generating enzyme required for sulfatase activity